ncbi:MAG: aryldialkylphosphatase [Dehalococcoidia bacterium]|nr:aryldialkylphosphatase [Dehalococcoidia bacterium]|tara:strand:- start:39 stop:1094 length:1056 start_codon:yes stop_codon:yes gene_type:complete
METKKKGKVQTVLGLINPKELGATVTHEHLLVDLMCYFYEPEEASKRSYIDRPFTMDVRGELPQISFNMKSNLQYYDIEWSIAEVSKFVNAGGGGLVDTTSMGLGRDPLALCRISRATGLNIIMGSSYYIPQAHPPNIGELSEADITKEIIRDITEGVADTGIKAGIIGEVGNLYPLSDTERKILRASARAQIETGCPISIHPGGHDESPMQIVGELAKAGSDNSNMIMGHLDFAIEDPDKLLELADTGCFLEYDIFGFEETNLVYLGEYMRMKSDVDRIEAIEFLIEKGYIEQVVIGQDVCQVNQLTRFGGKGYAHILENIVPRLRKRGWKQDQIDQILIHNPARALAFN